MRIAGKVFVGVCLTAVISVAGAAEAVGKLSRIEGVTVVSEGAQYVKGHEGMALKEGDRLMVMEGGSAVISFADGCEYALADNDLLTIGPTSTCAAPAVSSDAVSSDTVEPYSAVSQDPNTAAAAYQQAAIGDSGDDNDDSSLGWVPAAAGGLFAVLAAGDVGGDNDRRESISP